MAASWDICSRCNNSCEVMREVTAGLRFGLGGGQKKRENLASGIKSISGNEVGAAQLRAVSCGAAGEILAPTKKGINPGLQGHPGLVTSFKIPVWDVLFQQIPLFFHAVFLKSWSSWSLVWSEMKEGFSSSLGLTPAPNLPIPWVSLTQHKAQRPPTPEEKK